MSIDKVFGVHASALALRDARASVLASNLANADTPGYKARDLDFAAVLGQATGTALATSNPRHMGPGASAPAAGEALYRPSRQPSLDGNTVDVTVEQTAFMENAVRYQASLEFLGGRIRTLMSAIRGE